MRAVYYGSRQSRRPQTGAWWAGTRLLTNAADRRRGNNAIAEGSLELLPACITQSALRCRKPGRCPGLPCLQLLPVLESKYDCTMYGSDSRRLLARCLRRFCLGSEPHGGHGDSRPVDRARRCQGHVNAIPAGPTLATCCGRAGAVFVSVFGEPLTHVFVVLGVGVFLLQTKIARALN